jgi:hypothetical protein
MKQFSSYTTDFLANEEGLGRLSCGIHVIDEQSRSIEDALETLRGAVSEKLRIKRLLTRLVCPPQASGHIEARNSERRRDESFGFSQQHHAQRGCWLSQVG